MAWERWATVEGYSRYQVSDRGRMRSLVDRYGRQRITIISTPPDDKGRPRVTLYPGHKTVKVCWLVAAAFLPPPEPGQELCHYDGDPANNRAGNLRWDSHKGNGADMARHGRTRRCAHDPACRVTDKHGHSRCTRCTQDRNRRHYQKIKC